MKRYIMLTIGVLGTAVFLSGCTSNDDKGLSQLQEIVSNEEGSLSSIGRPAEINGMIASIEGNQLVVKNEVGRAVLSDEERQKRKEERSKMTQEQKQALRAQEKESLEVEDRMVEIPVGTVIIKGSGKSDGSTIKATFDDFKEGVYISVWKNDSGIELIKIKGL